MPDVMERINLNVPQDVRRNLQEMAGRQGRTEAELARALLIDALTRARREEQFRAIAEAHTAEIGARDLEVLRAFERLRG